MSRASRHRLRLLVATVAWLMQLCLPVAHAAAMAKNAADAGAWCGASSQALKAKIAALSPEMRSALEASAAAAKHSQACANLCLAAPGGALPPAPVTVALRAAGLEAGPVEPVVFAAPARTLSPPARGPPALS